MPVVDIHTHTFPDAVAAKAIPALVEEAGGHPVFYDGTVSGLLGLMDRAGIDVSVMAPVATKPSQVASINDWSAASESDRLVAFGAVHPALDDPAAEIHRMADLGLKGFKMHPEYQDFAPDEPRMDAIYEAALEHDMIILFHAGIDIGLPTLRGTPQAFAAVLDRHPGLRVILAHMGSFRMWEEVAALLAGRDVWFDTAYTLGHLPDDDFVALVRAHGTSRVLFGSDGPWTDPVEELERLSSLPFTPRELDDILGDNAVRLLGL